MTFFAWLATTRIGRWAAGLFALLAAFVGVALTAFLKGKHAQATKDQAKDAEAAQRAAQEAADAIQRSADAMRATNDEISKMPDAGTQRVGNAAPDSAAGWLRAHANRDQAGP